MNFYLQRHLSRVRFWLFLEMYSTTDMTFQAKQEQPNPISCQCFNLKKLNYLCPIFS